MRTIAAALMLTLQLRPLLGLALCFGLGTGDAPRMEEGCPMGDQMTPLTHEVGAVVSPGQAILANWEALASPHGCALADVCTTAAAALLPKHDERVRVDISSHLILRPADPMPDLARGAPPTPPPNA